MHTQPDPSMESTVLLDFCNLQALLQLSARRRSFYALSIWCHTNFPGLNFTSVFEYCKWSKIEVVWHRSGNKSIIYYINEWMLEIQPLWRYYTILRVSTHINPAITWFMQHFSIHTHSSMSVLDSNLYVHSQGLFEGFHQMIGMEITSIV